MAGVLAEILACLTDWDACPTGSGADVGDRRVHGVLPEVISLPVGDVLEQVRFGPAVDGRRGQDRVLELGVLPSAEGALGQVALAQPLQGQRLGPAGPAPFQRVRGEWRNTSPGNVSLRGCKGASSLSTSKMPASRASPSSRA